MRISLDLFRTKDDEEEHKRLKLLAQELHHNRAAYLLIQLNARFGLGNEEDWAKQLADLIEEEYDDWVSHHYKEL